MFCNLLHFSFPGGMHTYRHSEFPFYFPSTPILSIHCRCCFKRSYWVLCYPGLRSVSFLLATTVIVPGMILKPGWLPMTMGRMTLSSLNVVLTWNLILEENVFEDILKLTMSTWDHLEFIWYILNLTVGPFQETEDNQRRGEEVCTWDQRLQWGTHKDHQQPPEL